MSTRRNRNRPRQTSPMLGTTGAPVPVGGVWRGAGGSEPPERPPIRQSDGPRDVEGPIVPGVFIDSFGWLWLEPEPEAEFNRHALRFRIYDGGGRGGELRVWTNRNSEESPDPTGPPDGTLQIPPSPEPPLELFIEADQEFSDGEQYLNGIASRAFTSKSIFAEFVNSAGETSGIVESRVPPRLPGLDWDGRFNPDIPVSDGWFVGSLRDAFAEALKAVGMTESGWNNLIGMNEDGTINEKALSDKIISNNEVADRIFEHQIFDSNFLTSNIINSSSVTRLFQPGAVPEAVLTNNLFANTTVTDRLFANNVFTQSIVTRIFTAGSIIADRITANALSAITANLGVITAGRMRSAEGPGTEQGLLDIHLDERVITIKDRNGQTRVQIGKLTSSTTGWGITLLTADGQVIMTTDPALVGGAGALGDNVILAKNIAADQIGAREIFTDNLFVNLDLNVLGISNLGEVNAGFIGNGSATGPCIKLNPTDRVGVPWENRPHITPVQGRPMFIDFTATAGQDFIRHPLLNLTVGETLIGRSTYVHADAFMPRNPSVVDYDRGPGNLLHTSVATPITFYAGVALPVGVQVKRFRFYGQRSTTGDLCQVTLYGSSVRINPSTLQWEWQSPNLGTASIPANAVQPIPSDWVNVNTTIDDGNYFTFALLMNRANSSNTVRAFSVEVEYEADNYAKGF